MQRERLFAPSAVLLACGASLSIGTLDGRAGRAADDLPTDTLPSELPAAPPGGLEHLEPDRPVASAEQVALGRTVVAPTRFASH